MLNCVVCSVSLYPTAVNLLLYRVTYSPCPSPLPFIFQLNLTHQDVLCSDVIHKVTGCHRLEINWFLYHWTFVKCNIFLNVPSHPPGTLSFTSAHCYSIVFSLHQFVSHWIFLTCLFVFTVCFHTCSMRLHAWPIKTVVGFSAFWWILWKISNL